ncbi:hypothetical protein [Litorisediminicola beolgyonensis]|uniref:NADH dehydrogenase subunit E n=1 Tax=Litorisediminicola beolgyonensis TaxID=1173614 RepID=A0ABW3ZM66_9RHOB
MRLTRTLPLLALGLAACETLPEGIEEEDVARYDAAVATIGCDMVSEADYLPVELQAGLNRQQVLDITAMKVERQEALRLENGGVRVVSGPCTPAAEPAPVETAEAG